jgi:hypothetical protein
MPQSAWNKPPCVMGLRLRLACVLVARCSSGAAGGRVLFTKGRKLTGPYGERYFVVQASHAPKGVRFQAYCAEDQTSVQREVAFREVGGCA